MSKAAFNINDNEISGPHKLGDYYSIIQRVELIPESHRDYNTIRYRLLSDYRNHYMDQKRNEQKNMLRKKYRCKINKKYINNEK